MKNIAIFASGSGSNAEKIIEYFKNSSTVNVKAIFCNNPEAGVIERAERLKVNCQLFDRQAFKSDAVLHQLQDMEIDFIVLAGFLWLVPQSFISKYPNKIINLHPALLPKYGGKGMYGHHVHEAVIDNEEKESGITIHFVNEAYDEGAIIFQAKYVIDPHDSALDIAAKGQVLEHIYFPTTIEKVILAG